MSGGFFRGTSADQDTRFSNKQAKLLKSQKFAPELDHLVDMTKVKVDVIKPWIANRATELLGFEDEVLINFIYGLLDAKEVDGKQIQIQLTGFMEKNTGKFMKELWSLLLSAQKNVSGVPQQFLDAKEEETRKKKVEADRINHEIQKKREKEGREIEQDKHKKLDIKDDSVAVVDRSLRRAPSIQPEEEKEVGERRGSRAKGRHSNSPLSENRSPSRRAPSETRSDSKSFSNSRSYSEHKSRSMSRSPQLRRQSVSPDRQYHSPQRQPISPHRKRSQYSSRSPSKQRSPPPRQRSTSHSLHRSSSPIRRRSPRIRRRSPSPLRRQSPSPLQRRSPIPVRRRSPVARRRPPSPRWRSPSPLRRLSPSPLRRRWSPSPRHSPSPLRSRRRRRSPSPHWSPSPVRRRRRSPSPRRSTSPLGRRRSPSPLRRRRSPSSRRSPSPLRRRSLSPRRFPSPLRRRRSPSPLQSPIPLRRRRSPSPLPLPRSPRHQRRSPMRSPRRRAIESRISPKKRNRSCSPYRSHSPPHSDQRSSGTEHDSLVNGVESRKQRDAFYSQRVSGKRSPLRRAVERELVERSASGHKPLDSLPRQPPVSLRSPQCDPKAQRDVRQKSPVSSPSLSNSPSGSGSPSRIRRMASPSVSPIRKGREHPTRHDSPETSSEEEKNHAREIGSRRADSLQKRNRNSPLVDSRKKATAKSSDPEDGSPKKAAVYQSSEVEGNSDHKELRKTGRSDNSLRMDLPERRTQLVSNASEQVEYGPGGLEGKKFSRYIDHDERPSKKLTKYSSQDEMLNSEARSERTYSREDYRVDEKKLSSSDDEYSDRHHKKDDAQKSMRKLDRNKRANNDSDSDGNETHIAHHTEKKRSRRTESRDMALDEDVEYDSQKNERKEAKRRRKEEKKLRKEERRRRREERHRRREERRVGKLNPKYVDTVTPPSDFEKRHNDVDDSDGDVAARRDSHPSDTEGTESEQKKLEIELRKKALESLRAKKAISH